MRKSKCQHPPGHTLVRLDFLILCANRNVNIPPGHTLVHLDFLILCANRNVNIPRSYARAFGLFNFMRKSKYQHPPVIRSCIWIFNFMRKSKCQHPPGDTLGHLDF